MKRTEKINVAEYFFHIDEDAYEMLTEYLRKLKKCFQKNEGNEVLGDIEQRIAELLQMKIKSNKQIIEIGDVTEIIDIMGHPEAFDANADEDKAPDSKDNTPRRKQLYRDMENSVIGGVCSGLGTYLNISPILLRVIFIVLCFLYGIILLIYIALWISVPAARTTEERIRMRGKGYKIAEIQNNIEEELTNIKTNFRKFNSRQLFRNLNNFANHTGNRLMNLLDFIVKMIVVLIGTGLIIIGVACCVTFIGTVFFGYGLWFNNGFYDMWKVITHFISSTTVVMALICTSLLFILPAIAFIYKGLKIILRFKTQHRIVAISFVIAWLLSLFTLTALSMHSVGNFATSSKTVQNELIEMPQEQTLYLVSTDSINTYTQLELFGKRMDIFTHKRRPNQLFISPGISIRYTKNQRISLIVSTRIHGKQNVSGNTYKKAYYWDIKDSILYLDPLYNWGGEKIQNIPELDVTLFLPEGQKIQIDRNLQHSMGYVKMRKRIDYRYHIGKHRIWAMTPEGLELVSQTKKIK